MLRCTSRYFPAAIRHEYGMLGNSQRDSSTGNCSTVQAAPATYLLASLFLSSFSLSRISPLHVSLVLLWVLVHSAIDRFPTV